MTAIWGQDIHGRWQPLHSSGYPSEQALHDLVVQSPQMLPLSGSPRLTVVGTEVQLGTGRADVLAVESSGRLVIIEVKLAANSEARRAVVAQIVSYAAYLQGLDVDYLETVTISSHLRRLGMTSILEAVRQEDQQQSVDADTFLAGLSRSLADGAFRLAIVLDSTPDELVQTVGYLTTITDRIAIDLITVVPYDINGSPVLVPQRVDPGRRTAELSAAEATARDAAALLPGSEEFRTVVASAPDQQRPLLEQLTAWAEALAAEDLVTLATYRGKQSITTLLPRLRSDDAGLVTIYQEPKAAYIQLWPTVFNRRAPNSKAIVERELGAAIRIGQRLHTITDKLLAALTLAYREANGLAPD